MSYSVFVTVMQSSGLLLIGGSTVALLLAPESGEKLRGQLRERGQGFMHDVQHAADSRKIELRGRLESLRAPRDF